VINLRALTGGKKKAGQRSDPGGEKRSDLNRGHQELQNVALGPEEQQEPLTKDAKPQTAGRRTPRGKGNIRTVRRDPRLKRATPKAKTKIEPEKQSTRGGNM